MNQFQLSGIAILILMLQACSSSSETAMSNIILDKCDVVAERIVTPEGDTLVRLPITNLNPNNILSIPLSTLVEPLEIVKLTSPDKDAICGLGPIWISENYIVTIEGLRNAPARLFQRDGTFIGQMGRIGSGPGEYQYTLDDCHIDESNNHVYLYPQFSSSILVFDLESNYITSIPLHHQTLSYRINFHVSAVGKNTTVFGYCSPGRLKGNRSNANMWRIDSLGNITDETIIEGLIKGSDEHDYGSLHALQKDGKGMTLYLDSSAGNKNMMFRYDEYSHRLKPIFTVHLDKTSQKCQLSVTPHHYLVRYYDQDLYGLESDHIKFAIIDRNTMKGSRCRIYNDMLGGVNLSGFHSSEGLFFELSENNGYGFGFMYDSGDLLDRIEDRLSDKSLSVTDRDDLTSLKNSISPDDNNIIILGRFRN